MKITRYFFIGFAFLLFISCSQNEISSSDSKPIEKKTDTIARIAPHKSDSFNKVKAYIRHKGKHERVSVSSVQGDTSMMVDYYSIQNENWKLTIDHSNRIYVDFKGIHLGNLFLDEDSVYVEPYHMKMDKELDTLTDIIGPVWEQYELLLTAICKST